MCENQEVHKRGLRSRAILGFRLMVQASLPVLFVMSEGFQLPSPPLLAAGAFGGPVCMYTVTPFRNALTFASKDASLSLGVVFKTVFARGLGSA